MTLLSSGRVAGDVDDLELDPIGVVEEHRVIPRLVGVLLRAALDLGTDLVQPFGPLVDRGARVRLEANVVHADAIPVVGALGLRLANPDRRARSVEVPDRLAALALDLRDAVPAERPEQVAVERQALLDRRDDQIDVMNARGAHATFRLHRDGSWSCFANLAPRSCNSSTTTWSRARCARSRRATWASSASSSSRATGGSARTRRRSSRARHGSSSTRWASSCGSPSSSAEPSTSSSSR